MVMRPLTRFALENASVEAAREVGLAEKNRFVFVLDKVGAFVGAAWMQDLMEAASVAGTPPELGSLIQRDFPNVNESERLRDVWETVVASPAERIPVLAESGSRRVVGVLHKSDVLKRARDLLA
jgi:CIC family chloride channel protein